MNRYCLRPRKKLIVYATFLLGICLSVPAVCAEKNSASGRMICDDSCSIGAIPAAEKETGKNSFTVVSPIGHSAVKTLRQAPRLDTLDGKTIAVVGTNFMANITHPEIKRLILKHYPTAKVILQDETGSAGVYPAPGITRRAKEEFQRKLKELKVDAVISGNGGCGLCTPKETGSC